MRTRIVFIIVLLLGLAIGLCAGIEQAALGRSIYLVSQTQEKVDFEPAASQLRESYETLNVCFDLTATGMYLGLVVVLTACLGLYLEEKRSAKECGPI